MVLAACSPPSTPAPTLHLTSHRQGDDVTLTWQGHQSDVVVEFATEPNGRYTVLDYAPRSRTTYHHPDLIPATTFYYRVRPIEGTPTKPVTPTPAPPVQGEDWLVPRTLPDPRTAPDTRAPDAGAPDASAPDTGAPDTGAPDAGAPDTGAPDARAPDAGAPDAGVPGSRAASGSRDAPREPGGAPTNLMVEAVGPDAVRLTWTDNATDEDGYLVERAVADTYEVAFVVDPDVNYVGLLGPVASTYRVRAYHYGPGSNVVHEEIPG